MIDLTDLHEEYSRVIWRAWRMSFVTLPVLLTSLLCLAWVFVLIYVVSRLGFLSIEAGVSALIVLLSLVAARVSFRLTFQKKLRRAMIEIQSNVHRSIYSKIEDYQSEPER